MSAFPGVARAFTPPPSDRVTVSILHTTDIHGHILPCTDYDGTPDVGGFARCVTQIRRWRRKNPNTILVDVGDVYQGTQVALQNKGEVMIDLFNHLRYDAWVVGNHEFDWGIDPFRSAVQASQMPVLAANVSVEGRPVGDSSNAAGFGKLRRYIIKEIEGIRVAIVGVTTPGMPYWSLPENLRGLDFAHPVESVRQSIRAAKAEGAHAIVLAGHMGLKLKAGGDDFANCCMSLTSEFPEVAVFLAGHTHQNIPSRLTNGVLLTQANHYGIHAGRVDLVFDRASKRLLDRHARCELMDSRIRPDHIVISRAKDQLDQAEAVLKTPVGELADLLSLASTDNQPNDVERLIGASIMESLSAAGAPVDAVFHGVFDEKHDVAPGRKTIDDIWKIIPYENSLVTAQLTARELMTAMNETYQTHERRSLIGFTVETQGEGNRRAVSRILGPSSGPLDPSRRYTVAFNSHDSRSGGHRFMQLRSFLERKETKAQAHAIQSRDALIEYFQNHKVVHRIAPLPSQVAA